MSDKRDIPAHATYDQRYGRTPLPEPMKPGEISLELSNNLQDLLAYILEENSFQVEFGTHHYLKEHTQEIIKSVLAKFNDKPRIDFKEYTEKSLSFIVDDLLAKLKFNWSAERTLRFFEHFMDAYSPMAEVIELLLKKHAAPYILMKEKGYHRFHPISLEAEREAIGTSFNVLSSFGHNAATRHLAEASQALNKGNYNGAVRESINAVESVAKIVVADDKATLGKALANLERNNIYIHPALKKGWSELYGFASDESGIRHASRDGMDKVDQFLAIYMFGACASFAAYLANQKRQIDE